MPDSIQETLAAIRQFSKERDWEKFHTPKSVVISAAIEMGELLGQFQWVTDDRMKEHVEKNIDTITKEMADVTDYIFRLSDILGVDLLKAMEEKRAENARKYPVEKVKGRSDKYDTYTEDTPEHRG